MSTRLRAIALFRRILRVAKTWKGGAHEQQWIQNEARKKFQANRHLVHDDEICEAIQKGHNQVDIAVHHQIPYPRLVHVDPKTVAGDTHFHRSSDRNMTKLSRFSKLQIQHRYLEKEK
uniref:Uncharacterized protein AlNc14C198G8619 n=1 Tax=Albugo laibachii Nc14 TaxID=890382 RepID=F0WQE9_9STRA|nr:conserved hypothetical protein [Albugo laibachii Nc14]|eukprot:CCA23557.1 conserved hypothetical protein [Albugo laibachii Nc14]